MLCAVCRREARGFGFWPRFIHAEAPRLQLCSMLCQNITARLKAMIDPKKHEVQALAAACQSGGEYVESLGKTDLATFTGEEWATLIEVAVTAFQDHLRTAYANDPPPF